MAERFQEHRPHLRDVAFRMLGSIHEADDAVQEAWLRLSGSDTSGVENLRGWLTTVTGRICLDILRYRASRREEPLDWHLPSAPDGRLAVPGSGVLHNHRRVRRRAGRAARDPAPRRGGRVAGVPFGRPARRAPTASITSAAWPRRPRHDQCVDPGRRAIGGPAPDSLTHDPPHGLLSDP
ncbi:sigma factor [Nonomuraea rosea]|uniref:sigma factor n=1 Tax=Nonomuraea rosea TaxID=638574 RepID=UPI003CD0B570